MSHQLTGISGVHFVASRLSYLGFHAVPTTRNAKGPDLLVSSLDGSKLVSIQVKTTSSALREKGRGKNRAAHHFEWDIGWSSARENHTLLLFALVDLKSFSSMPDIFIVPSSVIFAYFDGGDPKTWRRARYHPLISEIEQYRNEFGHLSSLLS